MYDCEICKTTTSVQCWKPKKVNKQGSVTSAARRKEEEQKHEASTNKPKKNKGKKKKTAGLIIPKKTQQAPSVAHHQQSLSMAKLSDIFQLQQSQAPSKLNQFLKWLHNHVVMFSNVISHAPSPKVPIMKQRLEIIFNYIHQEKHVVFALTPLNRVTSPLFFFSSLQN